MSVESQQQERTIGLAGATGIGVGAIVGGGILALTGVAFAAAGPSAILAFLLNGVLATLTALSFAEVASKFPQSGGTYVFAKKVFSIETAFLVGWVVWFASIAAGVLYALGFGFFFAMILAEFWAMAAGEAPAWLGGRWVMVGLGAVATVFYAVGLSRRVAGGGQWANVGKVLVFAVLIGGGVPALLGHSAGELTSKLQPFFAGGAGGVVQAMGFTFIALQGFGLIPAVGGAIRDPVRTIPRAMLLSLAIALAIYIPLLFVVATAGVEAGGSVKSFSEEHGEAVIVVAAGNYLGGFGYWMVLWVGALSMLSALQVNVLAAAHVAMAMARDRSLPAFVGNVHQRRRTPIAALWLTTCVIVMMAVAMPGVGAAGAASGLIFLISFVLVHVASVLVRQRSQQQPPPFRVPLFPAVPVLGGLSCLGLAVFQGVAVPSAGLVVLVWLGLGGGLFLGLFARRARIFDASVLAVDPEAVQLRGQAPLVLVPIANPHNASGMVEVANALTPPWVGRVLLLTVVKSSPEDQWKAGFKPLADAQDVLREALVAAARSRVYPEALVTVSEDPWREIARVAGIHGCASMLLGLSAIDDEAERMPLDYVLSNVDTDIVVLRAPEHWRPEDVRRILIPAGGRGGHDELLARLLGSLFATEERETAFLTVLPADTPPRRVTLVRQQLATLARDLSLPRAETLVRCSDAEAAGVVAEEADQRDLCILGVQRIGRKKLFGRFTLEVARRTACPLLIISRRG